MPIVAGSRFFICADDQELEIYNADFTREISNRNGIHEEKISIKGHVNSILFPIFESNKLKILDSNSIITRHNIYITHCETSIQVTSLYGVSIDAIVDFRPELINVEQKGIDLNNHVWIGLHTSDPCHDYWNQIKHPAGELDIEIPEEPKPLSIRRINPERFK